MKLNRFGKGLIMEKNYKLKISVKDMIKGLKHYKSLAKQDLLRADQTAQPDLYKSHAESRIAIYKMLIKSAKTEDSKEVVEKALRLYEQVPFIGKSKANNHIRDVAHEHALENFFLLIGLDQETQKQAWSKRPRITDESAVSS